MSTILLTPNTVSMLCTTYELRDLDRSMERSRVALNSMGRAVAQFAALGRLTARKARGLRIHARRLKAAKRRG